MILLPQGTAAPAGWILIGSFQQTLSRGPGPAVKVADTLAALRYAKSQGLHTLSIVNVGTSTIARESETVLPTLAGPEIGVASTKAFTTQLVSLLLLVAVLGRRHGMSAEQEINLVQQLTGLPGNAYPSQISDAMRPVTPSRR